MKNKKEEIAVNGGIGIRDGKCIKTNLPISVVECEDCLTERLCPPICLRRGFIWGLPDSQKPLWELTIKQARKSKEDVSIYYTMKNKPVPREE